MNYEQKYKKTFSILRRTKLIVSILLLIFLGPYAIKKTWTSLKEGWQEGSMENDLNRALGVVKVALPSDAYRAIKRAENILRNSKSDTITKKYSPTYLEILQAASSNLNQFYKFSIERGGEPVLSEQYLLLMEQEILDGLSYLSEIKLLESGNYYQAWFRLKKFGETASFRKEESWANMVSKDIGEIRSKFNASGNAKEDFKIPPLPSAKDLKLK